MDLKWQLSDLIKKLQWACGLGKQEAEQMIMKAAAPTIDETTEVAKKIEEAISLMQITPHTTEIITGSVPFKSKSNSWQYENKRKPAWSKQRGKR